MATAKKVDAQPEPVIIPSTDRADVESRSASTTSAKDDVSFAKALKQLEEIVKALESGELSLEDSLAKFEEGIALARKLESVLDRAEEKVKEIMSPDGAEGGARESAGPEE